MSKGVNTKIIYKTCSTFLLIVLLLVIFSTNNFTSFGTTPVNTDNFTFLDWCLDSKNSKASVTVAQIATALSYEIATPEDSDKSISCEQADKLLRQKTKLDLDGGTYMGNAYMDIEDKTTLFITDLRPLQSLTNLKELILSQQLIADLKPLKSLTNLTRLVLNSNNIVDIRPLASLKNLRYLNLQNNQITDIKALRTLTKLTYLNVESNPIKKKNCPFLSKVCHF